MKYALVKLLNIYRVKTYERKKKKKGNRLRSFLVTPLTVNVEIDFGKCAAAVDLWLRAEGRVQGFSRTALRGGGPAARVYILLYRVVRLSVYTRYIEKY